MAKSITKVPQDIRIEFNSQSHLLTLKELKKRIKSKVIEVDDPVYKRKAKYEAFPLVEVLGTVMGTEVFSNDEFILQCVDGYSPTMTVDAVKTGNGYLAFKVAGRTKAPYWDTFKQGKETLNPEPFYLVWTGKKDSMKNDNPWPYQLVAIRAVQYRKVFEGIIPPDLNSNEGHGFKLFKQECIRCHSINLKGGVLAPELNSPKNITEYWEEKDLKAFIKNPESFRYQSKMPKFETLRDEEIDKILNYLRWVKNNKIVLN